MRISFFLGVWLLAFSFGLNAQAPHQPNASEIFEDLQKLNVLGSALYVAAHPDDENTTLIAWLANSKKVNTTYLSLTRGDGGQNLIGTEIRELLGVLRTQELLAARRIDGGQQMFTRANDFGYSKNSQETRKIWNEEEVKSDVVWAIRKLRPDVIVNRFSHDTSRRTHGHHTTSALLSYELFEAAGDKSKYPEQLAYVEPWQPTRLFFNTSWWFYGSREKFKNADKSDMLTIDVGEYYPLKGMSNTEISALSRSQHRCQGFGRTGTRGSQVEYLQYLKGERPINDVFDGIDITWSRLKGGEPIKKLLAKVMDEYDFSDPAASIDDLVVAYQMIRSLPETHWSKIKKKEIQDIILACAGFFAEAITEDYSASPGTPLEVDFELINRSTHPIDVTNIKIKDMALDTSLQKTLTSNEPIHFIKTLKIREDYTPTNPYWLNETASLGMYNVADQEMRGLPETPKSLIAEIAVDINRETFVVEKELVFKKSDPAVGEVYRPFEVIAPVSVSIENGIEIFVDDEIRTIRVGVKAGKDNAKGTIELCHPDKGWQVSPTSFPYDIANKGQTEYFDFEVKPTLAFAEGMFAPLAKQDNQGYSKHEVIIAYDHIPTQTIYQNAEARFIKLDLKKDERKIGYIMGAGDEIPENLRTIGYEVDMLEESSFQDGSYKSYDVIIAGVRAFNTVEWLNFQQPKIFDFVKNGGNYIVQYNTSHRVKVDDIAPYPLKLSRDRVTVEEAEIRFLQPSHEVLNWPNKITDKDFDNWVQERGLYFPSEWSAQFEAILSCNDPGEDPKDGSLLVAKYGEGYYVYTGLSFFRELPAGVPGAYRLFTNLVSLGSKDK